MTFLYQLFLIYLLLNIDTHLQNILHTPLNKKILTTPP